MTRRLAVSFAAQALILSALSAPASAQNLLLNPKLDVGTPAGGGMPGSADDWTLVNAGNATAAQFQGGFANSQDAGGVGLWFRAFLGTTAAGPVSSTLSQSVVAPVAGKYVLTFDAVIEQNFQADALTASLTSSGGPSASLDLLALKVTDATYTGGGFVNAPTTAPTYVIPKMLMLDGVNSGDTLTVAVTMTNGLDAGANPQSAVVDNFRLALVPEPASMALAGLGLLGFASVRRRFC